MKRNTIYLVSLALFSASLAGCPFVIDPPDPCPPWDNHCGPTTTPDAAPGQNVTDCAELVVQDPAVSLAGYTMYTPDQKRNNPLAGEPWYVYLAAGSEGVILPGASVDSVPGLFALQSASINLVRSSPTASAEGYTVAINPSLSYGVSISDFEDEVALARVELCQRNGKIESRFLFRGQPGASGVAHEITIAASVNGVIGTPAAPVTVEVR